MSRDLKRRQRRRNAYLKKHANSKEGLYVLSFSLENGDCSFKEIKDEKIIWDDAGKISIWHWLKRKFTD